VEQGPDVSLPYEYRCRGQCRAATTEPRALRGFSVHPFFSWDIPQDTFLLAAIQRVVPQPPMDFKQMLFQILNIFPLCGVLRITVNVTNKKFVTLKKRIRNIHKKISLINIPVFTAFTQPLSPSRQDTRRPFTALVRIFRIPRKFNNFLTSS
jgi:hypothetical protein